MKKFASIIALILVAVMALSMASCRTGGDGKDTSTATPGSTTPGSGSITPETTPTTPDTSDSSAADTTTPTPAPDTSTEAPKDTTTPAKDTTTPTPTKIEWKEANMTVYVSVENAWLRKNPDLDDASRDEVLHLRDALTCTATSESWMKVTYGGETRYIAASCVTTDDISGNDFEKVNDTVYVTVTSAWVRLAPSTATEARGSVRKGDALTRTAKGKDWSEIVYHDKDTNTDKKYYISNSCISTTKPQ